MLHQQGEGEGSRRGDRRYEEGRDSAEEHGWHGYGQAEDQAEGHGEISLSTEDKQRLIAVLQEFAATRDLDALVSKLVSILWCKELREQLVPLVLRVLPEDLRMTFQSQFRNRLSETMLASRRKNNKKRTFFTWNRKARAQQAIDEDFGPNQYRAEQRMLATTTVPGPATKKKGKKEKKKKKKTKKERGKNSSTANQQPDVDVHMVPLQLSLSAKDDAQTGKGSSSTTTRTAHTTRPRAATMGPELLRSQRRRRSSDNKSSGPAANNGPGSRSRLFTLGGFNRKRAEQREKRNNTLSSRIITDMDAGVWPTEPDSSHERHFDPLSSTSSNAPLPYSIASKSSTLRSTTSTATTSSGSSKYSNWETSRDSTFAKSKNATSTDSDGHQRRHRQHSKKRRVVKVKRDKFGAMGFNIRGGKEYGLGIYVSKIDAKGSADKAGVQVGDELISVNGMKVRELTHSEVVQLFSQKKKVTLVTERIGKVPHQINIEEAFEWINPEDNKKHLGPVEQAQGFELRRVNFEVNGDPLGMSVCGGKDQGVGVFVKTVDPGGLAERNGVKVGDQICDCNGVDLDHVSHAEAVDMLRSHSHLFLTLRAGNAIPSRRYVRDETEWLSVDELPKKPSVRHARRKAQHADLFVPPSPTKSSRSGSDIVSMKLSLSHTTTPSLSPARRPRSPLASSVSVLASALDSIAADDGTAFPFPSAPLDKHRDADDNDDVGSDPAAKAFVSLAGDNNLVKQTKHQRSLVNVLSSLPTYDKGSTLPSSSDGIQTSKDLPHNLPETRHLDYIQLHEGHRGDSETSVSTTDPQSPQHALHDASLCPPTVPSGVAAVAEDDDYVMSMSGTDGDESDESGDSSSSSEDTDDGKRMERNHPLSASTYCSQPKRGSSSDKKLNLNRESLLSIDSDALSRLFGFSDDLMPTGTPPSSFKNKRASIAMSISSRLSFLDATVKLAQEWAAEEERDNAEVGAICSPSTKNDRATFDISDPSITNVEVDLSDTPLGLVVEGGCDDVETGGLVLIRDLTRNGALALAAGDQVDAGDELVHVNSHPFATLPHAEVVHLITTCIAEAADSKLVFGVRSHAASDL